MKNEKLEQLKEQFESEELINTYTWKYLISNKMPKQYREVKLINMDEEELNNRYAFCHNMLYNTDPKLPGRTFVKNKIQKMIDLMNAEIMIRTDIHQTGMDRVNVLQIIKNFKENNKKDAKLWGDIVNTTPKYSRIKTKYVIDACRNTLGIYTSSLISYTLIAYMGVCPNDEFNNKYKRFCEKEGTDISSSEFIKQYLNVPSEFNFRVKNTGLTIREAEIAVGLKTKLISEMTTEELELLSGKLLPLSLDRVEEQITEWTDRLEQIEQVANFKNIILNVPTR